MGQKKSQNYADIIHGWSPRAELLKGVVGKHALLVLPHDKIDEELVNAAGDQLKVIGTHSVG